MPYYGHRWHLFSEQERRDFGEKRRQQRREELSAKWHAEWISKSGLKERLWTDKAISTFLGKPVNAGPISAWRRADVLQAEQLPEFVSWLAKRRAKLIEQGKLSD